MPKLLTEPRDRCEHAAGKLSRLLEQLGMPAHRDEPATENANQATRLRPLHQHAQAVQLGAALDREASIENVAGIQQLDQRERVHMSEATGLRQRVAGAVPAHEGPYPGDRRRTGSDRREIVIAYAARPAWSL